MFETAVLTNGPGSRRAFSTVAGITAQAALLGAAILVPMIFPEAMPSPQTWMAIFMPTAPPPPPPPAPTAQHQARKAVATRVFDGVIRVPTSIPTHIDMAIEPPAPVATAGYAGVPGGVPGGQPGGIPGGVLTSLLNSTRITPALPVPAIVPPKPAAEPHEPARYRMGGIVKPAVPIHRVEPIYPQLARQMRVEGVVEITGIIGTDGRMKEVQLVRGHPLLAPAAMDAVRKWIYAPTTLNGEPIEVIAPITITFHLN